MRYEEEGDFINIRMSKAEAVELLVYRARYGIEHVPSGTIPVTFDVKTEIWEGLLEWAGEYNIDTGPRFSEEFRELLRRLYKFVGNSFVILKD